MNPEQLVPTRELCKKLVDEGIVLDTYFYWSRSGRIFVKNYRTENGIIPAPTAEELLASFDYDERIQISRGGFNFRRELSKKIYASREPLYGNAETLASALAELAIKVKESQSQHTPDHS